MTGSRERPIKMEMQRSYSTWRTPSRSTLNAYQAHYTRSSGFRTRKCLPLARRVRLRVVACNLRNIFFNEKKEKEGRRKIRETNENR